MASWYYPNTGQQAPLTLHRKQARCLANFRRGKTSPWAVNWSTATNPPRAVCPSERFDYHEIFVKDVNRKYRVVGRISRPREKSR
jgi:hypothetical protein